jgi:hypothetical protein
MHLHCVSRLLSQLRIEVIVAHTRKVRLIRESRRKDDRLAVSGPENSEPLSYPAPMNFFQ